MICGHSRPKNGSMVRSSASYFVSTELSSPPFFFRLPPTFGYRLQDAMQSKANTTQTGRVSLKAREEVNGRDDVNPSSSVFLLLSFSFPLFWPTEGRSKPRANAFCF